MASVKDDVIAMIGRLPDDCTLEDIQYHLEVRRKIERGLKDIDEGRVVSEAEVQRSISEWAKSLGLKERKATSKRSSTTSRKTRRVVR